MNHHLAHAIHHWRKGLPLPVDLHTRLLSLGYDVDALEAKYPPRD
ncbi:hypothetical protein [Aquibium microcysteis]|nr:hypothetical protein [Aquibium microcysteis]